MMNAEIWNYEHTQLVTDDVKQKKEYQYCKNNIINYVSVNSDKVM